MLHCAVTHSLDVANKKASVKLLLSKLTEDLGNHSTTDVTDTAALIKSDHRQLHHVQYSSLWLKGQVLSAVRSQKSIELNKAMSSANTDNTHAHYGLAAAPLGTAVTLK